MLALADRDKHEIERFFSGRGLEAGYLVPTKTGLDKSIMDAHAQLSGYMRRAYLHDYSTQPKGADAKVFVKTWLVCKDELVETKSSLYRPESKLGDHRIWIYGLTKYVTPGNLLALLVHEQELFVVNTSLVEVFESADNQSSPFSNLLDLLTGAKKMPLDDKFSEWNLRLLRSFFSEANRGEEVFLSVDRDFLDQIGQDIGGDAGFLNAVRDGPSWGNKNQGLVDCILALVKQRTIRAPNYKNPGDFEATYRGTHAPSYLPYLAALVRAVSEHETGYYAGLVSDLKLQYSFGSQEMKDIKSGWSDLEKWTKVNKGRFGNFTVRRLGGYQLIGVPRSQSILKPSDVEDLARVFVQAQIGPDQELTGHYLLRILEEARATSSIFSAGFQKALENSDFEQPIISSIRTAYSDWDGTLPEKSSNSYSSESSNTLIISSEASIGISLTIQNDEPLRISPHWRLPAILDSGGFEVTHKGRKWKGQFYGTEAANSGQSPIQEPDIWSIVEMASRESQQFDVQLDGNEDSEPTNDKLTLRQHTLWVLVFGYDTYTGNGELKESALPNSGSAFLLAPPSNVVLLRAYLKREKPEYEILSAQGLPKNWLFVRIDGCSSLTPEQRLLPDGKKGAHPKPRAIRFVGGRSIKRGYSRMYLPYDLPIIELDAPEGSRINCPNGGVTFENRQLELGTGQVQFRAQKRFEMILDHSRSASYELHATGIDGTFLGKAKLRVAAIAGDLVDIGRPFSLDNLGNPMSTDEGLSGALLGVDFLEDQSESIAQLVRFDMQQMELGSTIKQDDLAWSVSDVFLDALAQSGGFDYRVARDMLQRLIQTKGDKGEPTFILLELRRLGHLEIAATHKGHIARVHPVKPTLYSLPSTYAGKPIWAVTGTLRCDHWKAISKETMAWSPHMLDRKGSSFKPWRLLINNEQAAIEACNRIGLKFSQMPCISIASWAENIETFSKQTFRNTIESIGGARDSAKRFTAARGLFTASPHGMICELWKVNDLDTRVDQLYVLANGGQYAFVRDSRWGVWLALDAFAKWMRNTYNFDGVYPIPITYEAKSGTVWLPARISPPSIIERVLVLASGCTPDVLKLYQSETKCSSDRVFLYDSKSKAPVLSVNRFYTDMAKGRWLAYRAVPENIARELVVKLGAVLDVS